MAEATLTVLFFKQTQYALLIELRPSFSKQYSFQRLPILST